MTPYIIKPFCAGWAAVVKARGCPSICADLELATIQCAPWGGLVLPAAARLGYDADTLYVFLSAREDPILVKETQRNGLVYRDSCLECFFSPPGQTGSTGDAYYNLEINAAGVILFGWGEGRHGRTFPDVNIPTVAGRNGTHWMVAAAIPTALFGGLRPGDRLRGNFQKCCEDADPPHYLTWQPIHTPQPDFHQPDFFGDWIVYAEGETQA